MVDHEILSTWCHVKYMRRFPSIQISLVPSRSSMSRLKWTWIAFGFSTIEARNEQWVVTGNMWAITRYMFSILGYISCNLTSLAINGTYGDIWYSRIEPPKIVEFGLHILSRDLLPCNQSGSRISKNTSWYNNVAWKLVAGLKSSYNYRHIWKFIKSLSHRWTNTASRLYIFHY